ncbi:MAG: hypothetical protein QXP03_05160 [Desulfurococcaceae archaeon]
MSYTKSSALRWFETLLEDAKRRMQITGRKLSLSRVLESAMRLGDVVFPKIVYLTSKLAEAVGKLQITMIESMITASIWYGLILLVLVTLVILTAR